MTIHFSKYGIDQACGGRFPSAFHKLHAFTYRRVGRNALEIAQLVDPHAQGDADFRIERTGSKPLDHMVELGLIAQASEHDFGRQPSIAGVKFGRVFQQDVGSIASGMDFAQDIERYLARGGNHANI